MTETEKLYDEKIAPKLMDIAKICKENGIPFLAVVEYGPEEIGETRVATNDEGMKMTMIRHCLKTAPNVDGYMIGLIRWAKKQGIDFSESYFMSIFEGNL